VACHSNHAIRTPVDADLAVRADQVCTRCHEDGTPAAEAFHVMLALIDSLQVQESEAEVVLARAEDLGMEVSSARYELDGITTALTQARSAIHTFKLEPVESEIDPGLAVANRSRDRALAALWEHRYRRLGLAASAGFILLLVIGLVLKIRELERGSRSAPTSHRAG
jgi:predicted CXXCH cytochrome family protein